ncbi:MAG: 6-bladed beta-propeller [Gemmatimonadota bacterium]
MPRCVCLVCLTVVAIGGAACGGANTPETTESWAGTVDTLPGGAVHVVNPAQGVWTEEDRWRLTEALRIGAVDGAGPELWERVGGMAVDGGGRLWVTDAAAGEVRVFDAAGRHVRTVGRAGGGPGEFRSPRDIWVTPAQEVWVVDPTARRIEVFDTAGTRLHGVPLQGHIEAITASQQYVWTDDGLLHQTFTRAAPGPMRNRLAVVRHRWEGGTLTALDTFRLPEVAPVPRFGFPMEGPAGPALGIMNVPYAHAPLRTLGPDGSVWISEGDGAYRIRRQNARGDTLRIIERAVEPIPVPDSVRTRWSETMAGSADVPELPDVIAPFQTVFPAPDGTLWVRRQTGPRSYVLDVFDAAGRYLGEAMADVALSRFGVQLVTSDALYGTMSDDLGVQYVVALRIEKPEP